MTWEVVCPEKGATNNFPNSQPKKVIFPMGQVRKRKFQTGGQNNDDNNDKSGSSDNKYNCTKVIDGYV